MDDAAWFSARCRAERLLDECGVALGEFGRMIEEWTCCGRVEVTGTEYQVLRVRAFRTVQWALRVQRRHSARDDVDNALTRRLIMSVANRVFGASIQESAYVRVLRQLADGIEAGVLDVKSFTSDDDLIIGELSISMVFAEAKPMDAVGDDRR